MRDEDRYSAEMQRAGAMVRALPTPAPRPDFAQRLRSDFVSGTLATTREQDAARARERRSALRLWMTAGAAAVAILALIVLSGLNRGPQWQPVAPAQPGRVLIDDQPLALDDLETLARHLRPGAHLVCSDSTGFELFAGEQLWIEMTPGSDMILPPTAGRWWGRSPRGRVEDGEVRFTTGAGFAGTELRIATAIAEVEVRGTTIAVIDSPEATCVCVYEGEVRMGPRDAAMQRLDAGRRRILYGDDRAPLEEEILPMERMKLQMLRDRAFPASERP
ncbi:MAG: hypothetical protein GF330_12730 [Candidatus Eisenbacteria bacterium]|nr:hypothetical protein [Candidatus Eisenbacteria bacterium]